MSNVNIYNIAKKAGVSKSTVSRVLNGKEDVKDETRKRILKIIDELNYRPNSSAQSLVTKKTKTIGIVVSDVTDHFFGKFIKGAEEILIKSNYHMMLYSTHWRVDEEWSYIKILKENRVDGILIISGNEIPDSYLDYLNQVDIPTVVIDRKLKNTNIPLINVDNYKAAYEGVKYLLDLGHRRIACMKGPENLIASHDRVEGYKAALKEFDIEDDLIFNGEFSEEEGYKETKNILKNYNNITAIFYTNDLMAIGGIKAIKNMGLKVPSDISVLGCDDIEISRRIEPPLTTLKQPRYKMGYTAMKILIDKLEGVNSDADHLPNNIIYEMELIQRDSVDKPKSLRD